MADNLELDPAREDLETMEEDHPQNEGRRTMKGRGFAGDQDREAEQRYSGKSGQFDSTDTSSGPVRSIEGWIVFISGVHEEATEDDVLDKASEYGEVRNLHLPLDRRTGFVKGYAMVEYGSRSEAEEAIKDMDGMEYMDQQLSVDWAFFKGKSNRRR